MEQEISLREIIETIMKGKWIIASVTLSAVIIAAIVSFAVLSPTYEASSFVRIQNNLEEDKAQVDLDSFMQTLKSDPSMNRIIEKLQIDPDKYSVQTIRNKIQLETIKGTNVMKIKVKSSDSLLITNIANMLAYDLGNRIEASDESKKIVDARNRMEELKEQIAIAQNELTEAKKQLSMTPEKQITKQTLSEDVLIQSLAKEITGADISDLAGLQMENETINPVYTLLQSKIAEVTVQLANLQADQKNAEVRIQESTDRIKELDQLILQEKLNAKTSDRLFLGFQTVFINPAIQPTVPVGPNKLLNMVIAAFVGGMISILFVFLRQYMRRTAKSAV